MAVYVVTGKLGGGKTLLSVKRIQDKLNSDCIVATNLDIRLHKLIGKNARTTKVLRIPDKPTIEDLNAIGYGNHEYDENLNGLLVLDECGTWFNSRNWNDKARKPVNDWFLHARKLGWDVILIIQDVSLLDSQARSAIAEHTVFCRRLDRVGIPVLSTAWTAITGYRLTLPKLHVGRVVYGVKLDDLVVDRWAARGNNLYDAYDTKQLFLEDYPNGIYSLLTPWHTHGRYSAIRNWRFFMRLTKIMWKRFKSPIALGTGMLMGTSVALAAVVATNYNPNQTTSSDQETIKLQSESLASAYLELDQPDPLFQKLDHTRISSYWVIDNEVVYELTMRTPGQGTNQEPERTFLSSQLADMGYEVTPNTKCHLIVSNGRESRQVFCF